MKIGFIGAGAMGAPMIKRLAGAFPGTVYAYDPNTALLADVAEKSGAVATGSVAELARDKDVIMSCVPNNDTVRSVYLADDGVGAVAQSGTVTVDCSTVGPDATVAVSEALKERGIYHLDASMLGSVKQANEGTISFVVGGEEEALGLARPALAACGEMIRYCGPSGSGNRMKLVHQTLVAGHAVAVAEALGLCKAGGINVGDFFDIVTKGTGFAYSRYFENRVPRITDDNFYPLFMLRFMLKDARLALEMVEAGPSKMPALQAVVRSLEEAVDLGWGDADFSAAYKAVEARLDP